MPAWSLLAGTSRLHESAATRGASAAATVARARRVAYAAGALLAGLVALLVAGFVGAPLPWWGWTLAGVGLALVPLYGGARVQALERAFDASGRRAGLAQLARILVARRGVGALLALARGWTLPFVALADLATLPLGLLPGRDRIHAQADLDALAGALGEAGASVEPRGRGLAVRLPARLEGDEPPVLRVTPRRLTFPRVAHAEHLELRGPDAELRRLRAFLEGPCCHALVFAWSAPAVRLEMRLNHMLREAAVASTLEERSLLLDEANRMATVLVERDLNEEEHAVLATLKGQRLRGLLATRMLTEPPGTRPEGRTLAPAAAMAPPLARILEQGGLANVKRLVFVPHWVVPVQTPWGEEDTLVNALTGKPPEDGGALLLDAMRRRAPGHLLDAGGKAQFLPAPAPTAALLREARAFGGMSHAAPTLEIVYVPFLPGPDGYVNAVTGEKAADLGPVPGNAAPAVVAP